MPLNPFDALVESNRAADAESLRREHARILTVWPGNDEIDTANRELDLAILYGRNNKPDPYLPQDSTYEFDRWLYLTADDPRNPPIPYEIEHGLHQLKRSEDAAFNAKLNHISDWRGDFLEQLDEQLPAWSHRRRMEQALAEKMLSIGDGWCPPHIRRAAEKMLMCRVSGMVGHGETGRVVAWDQKCSCSRFCPDESRHETKRLTEKYLPSILFWESRNNRRRLQYAVMTSRNVPAGKLMAGKKALMARFTAWVKTHPAIKAALVVQEDPLAADGTWNIHLNVILGIEGDFNWELAQKTWAGWAWFTGIKANGESLADTMRELMKYSATVMLSKSHEKAARGATAAPALLDYPMPEFREWVDAQLGEYGNRRRAPFRRVRSSGAFYNLNAMRWHESSTDERCRLSALAGVDVGYGLEGVKWLKLPKAARELLKPVLGALETKTGIFDAVHWVAPVKFDGQSYRVFSIPGDKSDAITIENTTRGTLQATGPPFH